MPLALSGLNTQATGEERDNKVWVPANPAQKKKRITVSSLHRESSWITSKKKLSKMTTIVHCLASETNRSKMVQGSQQTGAHLPVHGSLNIKYLGLDLLSLFFYCCLGWVIGLKALWILPPPWGSAAKKWLMKNRGLGWVSPTSNTNDKAVTWENNSRKSDFIVSDGEA